MNKSEMAKSYFLSGLNCSQSVVLSFKEEMDMDEESLKKISIGFGGGMARLRLTCGAVSGMCMVLSYILSGLGKDKSEIYQIIQNACADFRAEAGSVICGELLSGKVSFDNSAKPEERTLEYYKKRPCADLCALAASITEKCIKG